MLKKLIVAVLACITLFLSQRALMNDSRAHAVPQAGTDRDDGRTKDTGAAVKATRTAILF